MGALSANAVNPPRRHPGSTKFEPSYKADTTDEFYLGAVVCMDTSTGKAVVDNADADRSLGFCMQRTSAVADTPVKVAVAGIWWVAAVDFADADSLFTLFAPVAASDNPADIVNQTTGTPGALGMCIHIDVTATSGWLDLGQRAAQANA